MVALRTVPEDSTGVAHILEHTALCGSERYPVRDPFFMMLRRSLNTFMNAFTSSDWTAYPFATQNRKVSATCWMCIWMRCSSRGWTHWISRRKGTGSSLRTTAVTSLWSLKALYSTK